MALGCVDRCVGRGRLRLTALREGVAWSGVMTVTIYHNPACSTSRNTLAMIRAGGLEPRVIEYLKEPPSRAELKRLLRAMKMRPRQLLRANGELYEELGLADPTWSDDELIDVMLQHPVLIERPIVATEKGVRLCRPAETVLEILPGADAPTGARRKEGAKRPPAKRGK